MSKHKTWAISDTHWGHGNIIKYCNRPFKTVEEMDAHMISEWNRVVQPWETVYHLGDFAFATPERIVRILEQLQGQICILLGNHDKGLGRVDPLALPRHVKMMPPYIEINVDGKFYTMCHYPLASWNKMHHNSINLHGHCHGTYKAKGKQLDVGVDVKLITDEFRPVSFDEIARYMDKRPFETQDRHGEDRMEM